MANKSKPKGVNPVSKFDFWLKAENHYWETDMYTEDAKKYFRNMVEKIKQTNKLKDGKTLNRNHL